MVTWWSIVLGAVSTCGGSLTCRLQHLLLSAHCRRQTVTRDIPALLNDNEAAMLLGSRCHHVTALDSQGSITVAIESVLTTKILSFLSFHENVYARVAEVQYWTILVNTPHER